MTKEEFRKAWDWESETDEGIYDRKNEIFYFLDCSYGEDDVYTLWGAQCKEIALPKLIELVEQGCENITEFLLASCPAPASGAIDRLSFCEFDSIDEAWEDLFKDAADELYTETDIIKAIKER